GPEVAAIHASTVQRMRRAHMRRIALDAEVLMVPWHREDRCAKSQEHLDPKQLVVARGLGQRNTERIANQIAGDEQHVRLNRIDDRTEPPGTLNRRGRDMRVRRVDEREFLTLGESSERERERSPVLLDDGRPHHAPVVQRVPERTDSPISIWRGYEDD